MKFILIAVITLSITGCSTMAYYIDPWDNPSPYQVTLRDQDIASIKAQYRAGKITKQQCDEMISNDYANFR